MHNIAVLMSLIDLSIFSWIVLGDMPPNYDEYAKYDQMTLKVFMMIIIVTLSSVVVLLWRDRKIAEDNARKESKLNRDILFNLSESISRMNGFFDQIVRISVEDKMGIPSALERYHHVHDGNTQRNIMIKKRLEEEG